MAPFGYTAADAALERLRRSTSDQETRAAVNDLQTIFRDDPPAVFLMWPTVVRAVSTRFQVPGETGPRHHRHSVAMAAGVTDPMTRITSRFVLLIASAAIAPLIAVRCGVVPSLAHGHRQSVREGNLRVAEQVAEQIKQYIVHNQRVLRSIGVELRATDLEPWQQSRILKDYGIDFPELREISAFGAGGASARHQPRDRTRLTVPDAANVGSDGTYVAPLSLDSDGLPTTTLAVRFRTRDQTSGWVVGELALEELWRMVDRVKIGREGYALLLAENQRLVAHGDPDEKYLIASSGAPGAPRTPEQEFAVEPAADGGRDQTQYVDRTVATRWRLGPACRAPLGRRRRAADRGSVCGRGHAPAPAAGGNRAGAAGTVVLGWLWGRSFISRIFALKRATRAIAEGRLDERVAISGRDEIHELGDAFNSMADRLVELQDDVRKQERQAMFGKIAAGLVHDLSHPIQNIYNSCKLIQKMFDDLEYRDTFKRTVDREMVIVKRVLEDLRNIARPIPLERFPIEIDRIDRRSGRIDAAACRNGRPHAAGRGRREGRVCRSRPLRARPRVPQFDHQRHSGDGARRGRRDCDGRRGRARADQRRRHRLRHTPDKLATIFDDFVTTKRRGLGLGLAISKKIVEQLGGQIGVTSEVGKGTTVTLDFPRTQAPRIALVAG